MVVLVGPAGAGKSTFALRHFRDSEVLSTDFFRKLVSDSEADQSATPQAFAILRFVAARRLRRGRPTVVDATNVRRRDRLALLRLAGRLRRPAVAVVFDLPLELCLARSLGRGSRPVDPEVIRRHWLAMPRPATALLAEGFAAVHAFSDAAAVDSAVVTRG